MAPSVKTDNVLYHYLQSDLHDRDPEFFRALTARLISRLGVWMSLEAYRRLPLLVPYARRDPESRGNKAKGVPDQWGSPDADGYFRDDNSLVKGVPRSLEIATDFPLYVGRKTATGFVAAHVWRTMTVPGIAARNPLTYSFVPNIVWLPKQVAGLTDVEGSFVQRFLQRLSLQIFRDATVSSHHSKVVSDAWALLPTPEPDADSPLPDTSELSFYQPTEAFFARRRKIIEGVAGALLDGLPNSKIISTRYTEGIPSIPPARRNALGAYLDTYSQAVLASIED